MIYNHLSKLIWQLNDETIQEIDIGSVAVWRCLEDQRQVVKSAIVHDTTETFKTNPASADAGVMVHVWANVIWNHLQHIRTNAIIIYTAALQKWVSVSRPV